MGLSGSGAGVGRDVADDLVNAEVEVNDCGVCGGLAYLQAVYRGR